MDSDVSKSVVLLLWSTDINDNHAISSGFVFHRDNSKGLYILCTAHQLESLFQPGSGILAKSVSVNAIFYDDKRTQHTGMLLNFDLSKDVALVMLSMTPNVLSSHPISSIPSAPLSQDPLYKRQPIFSVHHPSMLILNTKDGILADFQTTDGQIICPNYQPGIVQIDAPLVMHGSSGAPVFDSNSKHVLCMIKGCDMGISQTTTNALADRLKAISLSAILEFLHSLQISRADLIQ